MSDGRPALREFCANCGMSGSGSNLGFALPMIADGDVTVQSFKYPGKPLKEIFVIDPDYLKWLVVESKASDRVKKSAARILCGQAYTPPDEGSVYGKDKTYDPRTGWECIRQVLGSQPKQPEYET